MGVQLHNSRATIFEAYRFVREKQQVGLLNREQVVQVLEGRCVLSVKIVSPFYTTKTLRLRSLEAIASIIRGSEHNQDRLDSLGLPMTLLDTLRDMLGHQ